MKLLFRLLALSSCLTCMMQAQQAISCGKSSRDHGKSKTRCTMTYFDRVENLIYPADENKWETKKTAELRGAYNATRLAVSPSPPGQPQQTLAPQRPDSEQQYVGIIRGAGTKVLYSGTILDATYDLGNTASLGPCPDEDWRVVVMARESSNILIYGPPDVSQFCAGNNRIIMVLPVTAIWADLYHRKGNLSDPLRKAPTDFPWPIDPNKPSPPYCGAGFGFPNYVANKFNERTDIRTCDRYSWLRFMYNPPAGPIYNSWTQPGASQGTISYVPAIGKIPNTTGGPPGEKAPSETLSFDVQEYPSQKWGYGYIGVPIVFEKANAATANLNSLVFGVSYDVPFSVHRRGKYSTGEHPWKLFVRPPDLRIQYGPELAVSTPHDLNLTAVLTGRLPVGFNVPGRPSLITLFPVVGLEGGNHVVTHAISGQPAEANPIFRKVVGYDASLRAPFIIVHAFLGDKPATIDFSWRTRYLSYNEPLTDYVSGYPERLTKQQRSYWRGSFIVPFSQLAQFKVTVQHGALPPDFDYLGYSVNVGLTLGNPGYTEH